MREARDQSLLYRVPHNGADDWYVRCRVPDGFDGARGVGHNHVRPQADEVAGKHRQQSLFAGGVERDDGRTRAIDVAELCERIKKSGDQSRVLLGGIERQNADDGPLACARQSLSTSQTRSCEHCTAEKCDEFAPFHWISSSARAVSVAGMSSPIVLAAFRLTISLYEVGNCTGSSLILPPRRMRST